MRIPIIKVKDGEFEHLVGSNSHDVLYVDEQSGGIQYLNLQCCDGTKKYDGEPSMQFVPEPLEEYSAYPEIKFVDIEEVFEIAIEQMKQDTEGTLRLHEMMNKYLHEKEICQERLKGDEVRDTSGVIIF